MENPPGSLRPDPAPQRSGLEETLDQHFAAAVPPVLKGIGIFYAVSSLSVPLFMEGPLLWPLFGATLALGLVLAAAGRALERRSVEPRRLYHAVTVLAASLVAHALLFIAVTGDPGQTPYLTLILAGSGFLILSTPHLVLLVAFTLGGWGFVSTLVLEEPILESTGGTLFAGAVVSFFAHGMRRRAIVSLARAERERSRHARALRWNEERFRALTESAQDAIVGANAQGHVTYLNRAAQDLWGVSPGDDVWLSDLLPSGRNAVDLAGLLRAPQEAAGGRTLELTARRRDGQTVPVEASVAAWGLESHPSFTLIVRDVTARKAAEREEKEALAQRTELESLRRMNTVKTQFLNTAAHELNTPITPLRLQLHMLRSGALGPLDARHAKSVEILDRNVERLAVLVQEILDVARHESGRIQLAPKPVPMEGLLREAAEAFGETARQVGVQLAVEASPGLTVQADRNRVLQVLYNLVSNALKFTPAGGRVTVRAEPQGEWGVIAVHDTGLGLTAEQMGRLFQPFAQVHDPMKVLARGTGLGLFICKGLVEAHGGKITVDSLGPGQGSIFRFTLPLAAAPAPSGRVVPVPILLPIPIHPSGATAAIPAAETPAASASDDPLAKRLRELI